MSRLLIRAGKSPFTSVVPETTLAQDVINSNTGNFLFQHAVWEALAVGDTEIVANSTLTERRKTPAADVAAINEKFDHFVVPMANSFRADFVTQLERITAVIEKLTIPVSVVGVGAQSSLDVKSDELGPVREATQKFVAAVLDRSPSIGVRGEFTRAFLKELGFGDEHVEIIGCPSLFRRGPGFTVEKTGELAADAPMALNLTPEVPGIGTFSLEQAAKHPNLTYVAQDGHDLRLLLWGVTRPNVSDMNVPIHSAHPLYREGRMQMYIDQWTWFDFLAEQDFVYGTRFHGNVAAIMAGTPAMLLAHDSRTLELAEYHHMPHLHMPEFTDSVAVEDLWEATDFGGFNKAMPENFDRYVAFLERHNLRHKWEPGANTEAFETSLTKASFPPAVLPATSPDLQELLARVNWLNQAMVPDLTRNPTRYEYPFEHPEHPGAGTRYARQQRKHENHYKKNASEIEKLRKKIDQLSERTKTLNSRIVQLEQRRWRARLRRVARWIVRPLKR